MTRRVPVFELKHGDRFCIAGSNLVFIFERMSDGVALAHEAISGLPMDITGDVELLEGVKRDA